MNKIVIKINKSEASNKRISKLYNIVFE